MDAAMYKALSGAVAQMRHLDVASQDLANVNTAGYKRQRLAFGEVLAHRLPADDRPGGLVAVADQRTNMGQGELNGTGNPFDLALEGDGFFVIGTARGERYTRNGAFTLKADGTLITPQGDPVLGDGGPLVIRGNKVEFTSDGTLRSDEGEIGQLKFVRFTEPRQVVKEGANLFATEPGNVKLATDVRVIQGSLEQSNVGPVDGMISLVSINRQFEAYERAMKLMDSVTEKMVSDAAR
ncbi:MAG TPA: flagellar basal-body rod protein FlgF [Terriglobales bacterium]|jgi:flagellar basal-body rod protein FlgF|nr:flagellar basal-body rod protein FlgF [Terriglobales bacterium]